MKLSVNNWIFDCNLKFNWKSLRHQEQYEWQWFKINITSLCMIGVTEIGFVLGILCTIWFGGKSISAPANSLAHKWTNESKLWTNCKRSPAKSMPIPIYQANNVNKCAPEKKKRRKTLRSRKRLYADDMCLYLWCVLTSLAPPDALCFYWWRLVG